MDVLDLMKCEVDITEQVLIMLVLIEIAIILFSLYTGDQTRLVYE